MDDDEELRSQCFGGDNPTSSFDQPIMKRYLIFEKKILLLKFLYRQRRWWNAYILFYEKIPNDQTTPEDNVEKHLSKLQLCML